MIGEKLKYLLAILNSKLGEWFFNQIGTTTGMGTTRWKKYTIGKLPIKAPTTIECSKIESIVDDIIKTYSVDKITLLDEIICQLYGLSQEETVFIISQ